MTKGVLIQILGIIPRSVVLICQGLEHPLSTWKMVSASILETRRDLHIAMDLPGGQI